MAYSDILARLKTDIEAVTGIGNVYDYKRLSKRDQKRKELFLKNGILHWWEISRENGSDTTDYLTMVVNKDSWYVQSWYAVDDSEESEKTFQALVDSVVLAFSQDRLLGGNGYIVEPVTKPEISEEMKVDVLCHTAKIDLKILTTIDTSP